MTRCLVCLFCLTAIAASAAQDTKSEVDRLFRQASSGEIRFQKLVQPSKDSLSAMGDSAAKYLVAKLTTTDAREKLTLVDIFRGMGKTSTPYLVTALSSDNKDQLRTTARCLADVKDTSAIDDLLKVTTHPDFTVRGEAITAIGKSGGGEGTAKLLEPMLKDSVDLVRKCIVYGLGANKSQGSIPVLIAALNDDSYAVRLCAYDALVAFDSAAHEIILSSLAESDSVSQKDLLIRLCGQLGIRSSKAAIGKLLADSSPVTRGWAVWSYSRIGDKSVMSKLQFMLENETDLFVRTQLREAIAFLANSKSDE